MFLYTTLFFVVSILKEKAPTNCIIREYLAEIVTNFDTSMRTIC
jgi:hypothetical protein